jgi:hypothetical protein
VVARQEVALEALTGREQAAPAAPATAAARAGALLMGDPMVLVRSIQPVRLEEITGKEPEVVLPAQPALTGQAAVVVTLRAPAQMAAMLPTRMSGPTIAAALTTV